MLNQIIAFSIRNKLMVGLGLIFLIVYGSYQFTQLPIDAVPDITNNQVQVITVSPSLGAPDVERLITFPIEQANSNIPGLKEIRSFSRFGLSLVTIVFEDETNIYWARQQVSERLVNVKDQIPKGAGNPELGPVTTGLGEIYQYVVRAKPGFENKYNTMQLRTIQDWIVRRQLLGIKGVADVSSFGGLLKQYEVAVDAARLKSFDVSMNDVFTALEKNNQNTGGAYIEKGPAVLYIRSEGLVESLDDIGNMVVKTMQNGTPVFIKDLATLQFGHATRYGAMTYNDQGEVAGAVVMMLKGENSSRVIKSVKAKIASIQKTLPEGVIIEPFLDRTKMVNNAIGTVERNLMEGALIVIFVLVLFLGNFRAGLLVASVIPLAMLFAVIMMNTFGVSGNLMSLGALDFGLIVDGAVIIVEAVMHGLHSKRKVGDHTRLNQSEMDAGVKQAAGRMMNAAVFGQIIILIVYLPIFSLEGIEGKMFKPMAQTVAFALLGAFILSLTYVPMMSALFMSRQLGHEPNFSDKLIGYINAAYAKTLKLSLHYKRTIVGLVFLVFSIAVMVLLSLGGEFIPTLEEGDFAVETRVLTGSNLQVSLATAEKASALLLKNYPEIEKVVTKIGSGEIPTDPMPIDAMDMMIILKDKSEWTSASTFPEMAEKMSATLEAIPGVNFGFQFPVQMRFNELMTGARQDVVCKIFGENLDSLATYAQLLGDLASKVEGAKDIYVERVNGMPQIVVRYNRQALAQYKLSIDDINKVVNTAFAGQSSGLVFEGEKRFHLVVRLAQDKRSDLSDVQNLLIPTPSGTQIPLYQLASVEIKDGPNQIQREDAKRRIVVGFNVRGRDVQSIVNELQQKVDERLRLAPGYFITYGGTFENLEAARKRLSIAVPVSLLLILLMLYFAFNSLKQGLMIFTAIPLSAIGGIFALAMRGMPFSISAGIGFIALFGVSVLNGIVLIAEFNRLKAAGISNLNEIVLRGTAVRLRPVLMTAFVASLGFLPMALSNGAGAEVQRPLATVVIGGLLVATFLTLIVLPILYILIERAGKHQPPAAPIKETIGILAFFLFAASSVQAQHKISFESAVDSALKNNLGIHNAALQAKYLAALNQSAYDIPQANVGLEYGQVNSALKDTRFSISQGFKFPTVYARQKEVFSAESKAGVNFLQFKNNELRKEVAKTFYNLVFLQQKTSLLKQADSLFEKFAARASMRLASGETNVLENMTAQTQYGQVHQQYLQVQQDKETLLLQFQLLLNTVEPCQPDGAANKMSMQRLPDSLTILNHPYLQYLQQQQRVSFAKTRLERSRLMPELTLGYVNQSIQGVGNDERSYTTQTRFQATQIGLGVPLFFGSQHARIKASMIDNQIQDNAYHFGYMAMQSRLQQLLRQYERRKQSLDYYEFNAVQNAKTMITTASQQFIGGEINYLEFTLINNQAITLLSEYADALKNYNETVIEINAFNP